MRSFERGTTLLEFALVILVLFTMIFGIIDFGRAIFAYHFVVNAAREGVRYASVRGAACTSPMTNCYPSTSGAVQTNLRSEAASSELNSSQFFTNTTYPIQSNSPSTCAGAEATPGCTVQVSVSYTFHFIFPFLPTSPLNISSTSSGVITQ